MRNACHALSVSSGRLRVDRGELRKGTVLGDDDALELAELRLLEIAGPRETRRKCREFRNCHRVVDLVQIALLGLGPARLGDLCLERDDILRRLFRILPADQPEQFRRVTLVGAFCFAKSGLR